MKIFKKNKTILLLQHPTKISNYFALLIVGLLIILYISTFSILNIQKFNKFDPTCYDLSLYVNMLMKIITGSSLESCWTHAGSAYYYIFLAPGSYLIHLYYLIFPHLEALLIWQVIIMACGAIPIYLIVRERLKYISLALAFSISYLFHPVTNIATMLGFRPYCIAIPLLLFSFYYLEKNNFKKFLIFIILANLTRIDVVIMTMLFGICLIIAKKDKRYGKVILSVGAIWLVIIAILVSISLKLTHQSFDPGLFYLEKYGNGLRGTFQAILNNLSNNIASLSSGNLTKLIRILALFIPLGFISLLRPVYLVPIVFSVGHSLLVRPGSTSLFLALPFVYLSSIYGLERLINIAKRNLLFKKYPQLFASVIISLFAIISHYYLSFQEGGPIPLSKNFDLNYYKITSHDLIGQKLLSLIPRHSSCITQYGITQHLPYQKELGIFGITSLEDKAWEYIFLDLSKIKPQDRQEVNKILTKNTYSILAKEDDWLLLKRNHP